MGHIKAATPISDGVGAARVPGVVVVGGGVAGISAAIELAERGLRVTVLEGAETLGGKVKGWRDPQGYSLEHGLHGWWLEYTNFRELLERVGLTKNLTKPVGPFTVIHRNGIVDRLTFGRLPSPFHALGALRGLKSVGLRGKLSAIRAGLSIAAFDNEDEYPGLDRIDFHTWLRRTGVSIQAAEAIFEPTIRSNLFLPIEQTSAAAGINAILRGLRRRDSWQFSWLHGNTGDYLWKPLASYLGNHGGQIRLGARVTGLHLANDRVKCVLVSEAGRDPVELPADYVILAVDIESIKSIIRRSLNHIPFFNHIFNLSGTDVLVTRTWFQGNVQMRYPHAMLTGFRAVDAFIDVTQFQKEACQVGNLIIETQSYLGKSWMRVPDAAIRHLVLSDLKEVLPELAKSRSVKTVVIRHPGLFTAFRLGFNTFRPTPCTPVANLYLAGDWIRAPEPVMFMENAVVTSRHAASAILKRENRKPVSILPLPPPDAPVVAIQKIGRAVRKGKRGFRRLIGFSRIGEGETA